MKHTTKAFIRGIVPLVIMTGVSLLMMAQGIDTTQVKSTFITGLIITFVAAASVIYDIQGWSIKKQSVVHFIVMLVFVYPCLLLSGWFQVEGFNGALIVLGIFLIWGVVLWSIMFFLFTKVFVGKQ